MFWLVLSLFLFVIGFLWLSIFFIGFSTVFGGIQCGKNSIDGGSLKNEHPQKKTTCVQNAGKTLKITSIVDENHKVDVGILNLYLKIVGSR